MLAYTIRRILMLIPVLIGMSIITFAIVHAIPGDPAKTIVGDKATPEQIAEVRESLGLNKPAYIQYFHYLGDLLQGDLGTSLTRKVPISEEIGPFLAATTELAVASLLIAIFFGVNLGILSAWRQNSWLDYSAMLIALIGVSMPVFWLGLMEQWLFAQNLGWLPSNGRVDARMGFEGITDFYVIDALITGDFVFLTDVLTHLILPAVALGTIPMAIIARMTRSSMLEVMRSDYIRTARAKGLSEFWVVYKHTLKNACIPVLTVAGLQLGLLLGGAVLTETIFSWPGVGRYIYDAINARDYPVIQSGILILATIFVVINLIVDLLYAWIDPRIQYGKE
ncbi:ABC transporter permease [Paenactinomyces guangxiensis]|uniref:ABC transporter permease n=1 Tax=Paenactinomyces guangxiensis TaxID=1490290 RepID=A0A7W1WPU6_9BACL|nr:ABC transporter permease [Paenactinomyces guangxiensis]MBA4493691.1 ABC transporter permease [Paenactinomyces guangxiensis]MBH8590978.1 ABC transporter permease [Paenactinomyces guangxiensis]